MNENRVTGLVAGVMGFLLGGLIVAVLFLAGSPREQPNEIRIPPIKVPDSWPEPKKPLCPGPNCPNNPQPQPQPWMPNPFGPAPRPS